MRISDGQRAVLSSFVCERLKENGNRGLVASIKASRNPGLVKILGSDSTWEEEQQDSTAYYVVKNTDGLILAFFSIRCGELFMSLNDELMTFSEKAYNALRAAVGTANPPKEVLENARKIVKEASARNLTMDDILNFAKKKQSYKKDVSYEESMEINRVAKIYPAIDLNLFGVNEDARAFWKSTGLPQRMGETLFWYFIVTKLETVLSNVGAKYLYLFAADDIPDGALVNYYKVRLQFEIPPELGANKPHFDFQCQFMCREIAKLIQFKEYFFDHFNSPIV